MNKKKERAVQMRKDGKTYSEIGEALNVPKSTLSFWLAGILIPKKGTRRRSVAIKRGNVRARVAALLAKRASQDARRKRLQTKHEGLTGLLQEKQTAMIALAVLYLGEGAKTQSRIMFGNSDPRIVAFFLRLLRHCFPIDESKFRCTVQCRADQDIVALERFWSRLTSIPSSQFYATRRDPRTIGKPSKNPDYKGVCRIDYFSSEVFNDVAAAMSAVVEGP